MGGWKRVALVYFFAATALAEALAWRADVALLEAEVAREKADENDLRTIIADYRQIIEMLPR